MNPNIHAPHNTPDEYSAWLTLWQGYQVFYETEIDIAVTKRNWQAFFDEHSPLDCLAAYDEAGIMRGFAHTVLHEHTWSLEPRIYLIDLFTAPEVRGQGVGRGLINAVYESARARGCAKVHWLTTLPVGRKVNYHG